MFWWMVILTLVLSFNVYVQNENDVEEDPDQVSMPSIESSTEQLLHLDIHAHNEQILMDANLLLRRLVLPMSFPWCHKSTLTYKNMARDIDELPGLLSEGQKSEGTMYSGKPRKPKAEEKHAETLSSRRSSDPGVILLERREESRPAQLDEDIEEHGPAPASVGPFLFASFRESVLSKNRCSDEPATTEVKLVSFRFGRTSSRSTIFPENLSGKKRVMLLQASFSEDFQRGKRIQLEKANEIARELGSYDYRFGLPPMTYANNRVRAGRTRLIWSTKHIGGQRPSYRSMLTGKTLENGAQKRPIRSKVSIMINGQHLCVERPSAGEEENGSKVADYSYTTEEIDAAIMNAFEGTGNRHNTKSTTKNPTRIQATQCSLGMADEGFMPNIMKELALPLDQTTVRPLFETRRSYEVKSTNSPSNVLHIQPPIINSLPTEDGIIRTFCSVPGRISNSEIDAGVEESQSPPVDATAFLAEMPNRLMACGICWSQDAEKEDLCICSVCGARAHVSCHPGDRKKSRRPDKSWKCNSCKDTPSVEGTPDESIDSRFRCKQCPVVGGMMSRFAKGWYHDVCYAWCNSKAGGGAEVGQCVICGDKRTKVIRCAARGCSVQFHPMCAMLVSRAAQMHRIQQRFQRSSTVNQELDMTENDHRLESTHIFDPFSHQVKEADAVQSMQYDLVSARVGMEGQAGNECVLYIGFCGIHSRQRLPEFYGLYPGASFYDEALRIPPLLTNYTTRANTGRDFTE